MEVVEPRAIRNVTLFGESGTARPLSRGPIRWSIGSQEYLIRVGTAGDPERSIRTADGLIVSIDAAAGCTAQLETVLRAADDYQVARLCLIDGMGRPGADFDRCVRAIAEIRGAIPLPLHIPLGAGTEFDGVLDLIRLWDLGAADDSRWQVAAPCQRRLRETLGAKDLQHAHQRIRTLTRIGDAIPILCGAAPGGDGRAPLLDAVARYLPSPMDVCQPEHALDY
ncbi:GTP-binding protein [Nocardia sp. NPDC127579]|uniref:GTP-binding protein n=1 Tax=Nocardia sp. NPDC127579 TaxID=3345402 RepID=UPI003639A5D0